MRRTLLTLAIPIALSAYPHGAPPETAGAPGERICWACHNSNNADLVFDSQALRLDFPDAVAYRPAETLRITVTNTDVRGVVYGAQISVRDRANRKAGELKAVEQDSWVDSPPNGQQYLNHDPPSEDGVWLFEWKAPASDLGALTFYVSSLAADGNDRPNGDHHHVNSFVIPSFTGAVQPSISSGGVVHAATLSPQPGLAPNTFGSVFGSGLAPATLAWDGAFVQNRAPSALGGVRVLVNGSAAFVSFVGKAVDTGASADQINFIAPHDSARGPVSVLVETPAGRSEPVTVMLGELAPGLFPLDTGGRRYAAAISNDGAALLAPPALFTDSVLPYQVRPARPGETIQLFGTGFGPTNPPVAVGELPAAGIVSRTTLPVTVTVGGLPAVVAFAGLAPFVGGYQVTIEVPDVTDGEAQVVAAIGGVSALPLYLPVER